MFGLPDELISGVIVINHIEEMLSYGYKLRSTHCREVLFSIIRPFPIFEEELHEPGDGGHEDGAELLERHVLLALTHQDVAELVLGSAQGYQFSSDF